MINKKSDQKLKDEIKSNRVNGVIYAILCIIFMIIFAITAFFIIDLHPIYTVIVFGFYTVIFMDILTDYGNSTQINKVILEIRDMNKDLDIHYKKINELTKKRS